MEKHTLESLMRVYAKTYNQGTQLVPVSHEMYVAQTPLDICCMLRYMCAACEVVGSLIPYTSVLTNREYYT